MQLTSENYYSQEANQEYMSVSGYKDFAGTYGKMPCEFYGMEKLNGRWQDEKSTALLVGSYVDSYFEGSLDQFKKDNPEIFTQKGELKANFKQAEEIIARIERDEYFMKYMSGQKQVIMTGELFGAKWKIKMDSYIPGVAIVDLKVMASITDLKWVKDIGYLDFVRYWGYDIQGAVYQETPKYNLLTLPTIPTTTSTPAKHAAGGRVGGGPQLSWLAEEGWDEFVIPTNPSRRTRALDLYEQAGEALGVSKHAEGGHIEGSNLSDMVSDHNLFTEATRNASYGYNDTTEGNYEDNPAETFAPVSSEVPASTPQTGPISVNVAVSPNFQIEAKEGQSEEDIVAVIRRHLGEIADELGGNIADKLSEVFANMPVTSTKGA